MLFAFLYCPFHKHANSEVQRPNDFFAAVNHLNDLLENSTLLQRVQKVMVCDLWLVDFEKSAVSLSL